MELIVLLVLAGLILAALELILPGGILGVLSAGVLIWACVLSGKLYGATGAVWSAIIIVVLLAIVLYVEFKLLANTRLGKVFFLTQSSGQSSPSPTDSEVEPQLIGKTGTCATALAPSGKVLIEGSPYEARSQGEQIEKGTTVKVIAVESFFIVVK